MGTNRNKVILYHFQKRKFFSKSFFTLLENGWLLELETYLKLLRILSRIEWYFSFLKKTKFFSRALFFCSRAKMVKFKQRPKKNSLFLSKGTLFFETKYISRKRIESTIRHNKQKKKRGYCWWKKWFGSRPKKKFLGWDGIFCKKEFTFSLQWNTLFWNKIYL